MHLRESFCEVLFLFMRLTPRAPRCVQYSFFDYANMRLHQARLRPVPDWRGPLSRALAPIQESQP
jgi:hypothetical protein